ncbi:ATP-binding protein [Roseivirga sp. BDSF3-8]|uniref:ATP-binding protein n=1 Tax=Roseivirga sp. BDSF3-8 TaxID=3241598 RepID=UPI003531941B
MNVSSQADLQLEIKQLKQQIKELEEREASRAAYIHVIENDLQKYQLAANGANDGLWDWDIVSNEVFVSEPWKKMLGYTEREIDSSILAWETLLHPDDRERAIKAFYDYLENRIDHYSLEFRLRHKDGTYRWIASRGTALRDRNGIAYRISGSHTDITDRKRAEEVIQNSINKYRNLFQNSLVGMFRTAADTGEILEANAKALELFNASEGDKLYTTNFYTSETQRLEMMEKLLSHGKVENEEMLLKRNDGTTFWVNYSSVYYPKENRIEAVLKDITDTKQNFEELQKVNFELDNFVYHASHDLRSPLRSILGLIHLLRSETDPSGREKIIEMIEGSIHRLDSLVVDLLSISRNNRVNDPKVSINFLTEINNTLTSFYTAEEGPMPEILTRVYQPYEFRSDLTRIRIVMNNIISNAIKYRSREKDYTYVEIVVKVEKEKVTITVSDNGEGISEEKLENIFEMFYRASESSEGSGLGLYIVKNVIDKMKGDIKVESKVSEGTRFTVVLPAYSEEDEETNA